MLDKMVREINAVLSNREVEVLELIVYGHKNREIALLLNIEECTVRFHVGNILTKLGVKNRTQATFLVLQKGWIRI